MQPAILLLAKESRRLVRVLGLKQLFSLHGVQPAADQADAPHVLDRRALEKVVAADVGVAVGDGVLQLLAA